MGIFCAYPLTHGQYTGDTFATEIQRVLRLGGAGDQNLTVTYEASRGTLLIMLSDLQYGLTIFTPEQINDKQWQDSVWFYQWPNYSYGAGSTTLNRAQPAAANALVNTEDYGYNFDAGLLIETGQIDLTGVRELYVHCSVSDYGALTSNGMRASLLSSRSIRRGVVWSCGAPTD